MPQVSVVTPFYNTAAYLPECIESVIAQSFTDWEYLLVDNCSTDGSSEIAEEYARRDKRIRLIRNPVHVGQVPNYNNALASVSPVSMYSKIVQADDFLMPECLERMVYLFETDPSIGVVSSYFVKGDRVCGPRLRPSETVLNGRLVCRRKVITGDTYFGSPTVVMYRSSLVRAQKRFYDENCLHEDTEVCMRILQDSKFGFVPQVLSFLRTENESISSAVRAYNPNVLDRYIIVQKYAGQVLDAEQAIELRRRQRREYYQFLANSLFPAQKAGFWQYHRRGLKTIGEKIEWVYLSDCLARRLLTIILNPGKILSKLLRSHGSTNLGVTIE